MCDIKAIETWIIIIKPKRQVEIFESESNYRVVVGTLTTNLQPVIKVFGSAGEESWGRHGTSRCNFFHLFCNLKFNTQRYRKGKGLTQEQILLWMIGGWILTEGTEPSRCDRVVSSWLILFGQCHVILSFLVEEDDGSLNSELLWPSLSFLVEAWPSLVSVLPACLKKIQINNAYPQHSLKDMFAFKLFLLYSESNLACVWLTWLI